MASPCELLIRSGAKREAARAAEMVCNETARIEAACSRYLPGNPVDRINTANGARTPIDDEMYRLLTFAAHCHELSDGLFDITSGILRRAWRFDGQELNPDRQLIERLLHHVGWEKTTLGADFFQLPPDMQIDLGGLAKEYAVDRVATMAWESFCHPVLVNFGGDIRAIGHPESNGWRVGIENQSEPEAEASMISLVNGAITTSGTTYRYCMVGGKRYGHLLNPRTGWPVDEMPESVTVIGTHCIQAGFISSLALLHGIGAEQFLEQQDVPSFCRRSRREAAACEPVPA